MRRRQITRLLWHSAMLIEERVHVKEGGISLGTSTESLRHRATPGWILRRAWTISLILPTSRPSTRLPETA